jgi:P4 family phage/plasmid primase-like protien
MNTEVISNLSSGEIPTDNTPVNGTKIFDPVIEGLAHIGQNCNNAASRDGIGFNKYDAEFGNEMADKIAKGGELTAKEYLKAGKMLQKYHKQFAAVGITKENLESAVAKFDISAIIDGWIKTYNFKTRTDSGTIYYYKEGVYVPGEILIEKLAEQDIIGCNNKTVQEAKGTVRRRTYLEPDKFLGDLHIINVKNGLLDLKTAKLHPHSPDVITTVQLPIEYDPTAKCLRIDEFLEQVLDPDDIELVYEMAGWFLWRQYHVHKAIMLYGVGRNGKGTLLRLFEAFLGIENCSHVSLQKLIGDRFAPVDLVGKAANIFGDLPQKDLSETDIFKCLTGGDTIRVEAKFIKPFDFKNEAKLLFSANALPKTSDSSTGFFVRWIIILFRNQFCTLERPLNPNLDAELQTPEELSGFLNKALEGLARLRSNNWQFSYRLSEEEIRKMYQRLSDPVFAFMEDCCIEDPDSRITKNDMHKAYRDYAQANKLKPLGIKKFGKFVQEQNCIPVEECWILDKFGSGSKGWQGVKIKEPAKSESESSGTNLDLDKEARELERDEKELEEYLEEMHQKEMAKA